MVFFKQNVSTEPRESVEKKMFAHITAVCFDTSKRKKKKRKLKTHRCTVYNNWSGTYFCAKQTLSKTTAVIQRIVRRVTR